MNPSESAIQIAIEKLKKSPGVFQRLVEDYCQILYPKRFTGLIPKGRNPDEVTIKGWPDAYEHLADGSVDVIEVTHSEDWRRHLKKDIEKAESFHLSLAGFTFVAWARTPEVELLQKSPASQRKAGRRLWFRGFE